MPPVPQPSRLPRPGTIRRRLYDTLAATPEGMTANELCPNYAEDSALAHLVKSGWVVPNGEKRGRSQVLVAVEP